MYFFVPRCFGVALGEDSACPDNLLDGAEFIAQRSEVNAPLDRVLVEAGEVPVEHLGKMAAFVGELRPRRLRKASLCVGFRPKRS